MGDHTRTIMTETMNKKLFITLAAATLLIFAAERYAGWYNTESVVNVFVKMSYSESCSSSFSHFRLRSLCANTSNTRTLTSTPFPESSSLHP